MKKELFDWANLIFILCCGYGFLVALVFALEIPLKFTLIIALTPAGVVVALAFILFYCFNLEYSVWRKTFSRVSSNETNARVIKTILLPLLLVALYFYIRSPEGQQSLYTESDISCQMTVHPCGSSYERNAILTNNVWDAADLISQPSENEIFFTTNAVIGVNQSRRNCPQTGAYCSTKNINPGRQYPKWLGNVSWSFSHELARSVVWHPVSCPYQSDQCDAGVLYDNGIQTGVCSARNLCIIEGWCPPISLNDFSTEPMFQTNDFTIFLDLRPDFPEFREPSWTKGGEGGYKENYAEIYSKYYGYQRSVDNCLFNVKTDPYCPRFRLEDIVTLAGGNFTQAASLGGQFKIEVHWDCTFDWGKDILDCLPSFEFINKENNKGKPKIYSQVSRHEVDRRTMTYTLGLYMSISHLGKGKQIQLFNLVFYAQFIFVSYSMIKGPFVFILRCFYATYLTARTSKSITIEQVQDYQQENSN